MTICECGHEISQHGRMGCLVRDGEDDHTSEFCECINNAQYFVDAAEAIEAKLQSQIVILASERSVFGQQCLVLRSERREAQEALTIMSMERDELARKLEQAQAA